MYNFLNGFNVFLQNFHIWKVYLDVTHNPRFTNFFFECLSDEVLSYGFSAVFLFERPFKL